MSPTTLAIVLAVTTPIALVVAYRATVGTISALRLGVFKHFTGFVIRREREPGKFGFNVGLRAGLALLGFAYAVIALALLAAILTAG